MQKSIEKILLLVAMQAEADPIIRTLDLNPVQHLTDTQLPFKTYENNYEDRHIVLLVSGTDSRYRVDNIGTQAATLMAYVGIEQFQPDLVVSVGTAGGFVARGAKIGTVYLSDDEFIFHDRQIPLAGFDEQGVGHYPAVNVRALAKQLNLPFGKISSGSSFTKNPDQMEAILKSGAVAKEMEAAAIAWVCWLKQTPCMAIKAITNLLDQGESSEQQFTENFSVATQSLCIQLKAVMETIRGKTVTQLSERFLLRPR